MLKHIKLSQLKPLLHEYLNGNDFTRPFIVAGWTATGKSAIVSETLKEVFGNKGSEHLKIIAPDSLFSFEASRENDRYLNLSIQSEKETRAGMEKYLEFLSASHTKPIIIEQTFENQDLLEDLGRDNDIAVIDFDRDEWLRYMQVIKGTPLYNFLSTLPVERIHSVAKLPEDHRLRSHIAPTPRRWENVIKHYEPLMSALSRLDAENRTAVIDLIKTAYC